MEAIKMLNVNQVAALLEVHRNTVSRWRRIGKLPTPIIDDPHRPYWAQEQIATWKNARLCTSLHHPVEKL